MEAESPNSSTVQRLCNKCAEYDWVYIISGYKTLDGGLEENTKCLKSPSWGTQDVMGGSYYRRRYYPGVFYKRDPHPNPNLRDVFIFPLLSLGEMKSTASTCSTIKTWWSNCRQHHGQQCSRAQSHSVLTRLSAEVCAAFRVIDVKEKRVIPASPNSDYVALSYVWGRPKLGRTFRQAFLGPLPDDLSQAQTLTLNMEEIPRTIRDAIDVVERLGEHYLWVDALCIFQEDVSKKLQMISIMDKIYRQAILIIIAAGGNNSDSGLGGLQPRSRNFEQVVGTICDQRMVKLSTRCDTLLNASSWTSRAWTYQEEHFSKFKLVFVGDRVFYKCPGAFEYAEDVTEYVHADRIPVIESNINSEWPFDAVSKYIKHVEQYTTRQLSFPDDILNAFTAIIQDYSETYHTEFC
ncbi:heterokaryon incompatibility protein-domain-containing protein [Xylaria arbuscula]|nr:heterokaryon incompatibility protein-domain-containing protein [Xylaria arbuscula]